jgi:MFS family permease
MTEGTFPKVHQKYALDSPPFSTFVVISALNFFRIGYQLVATAWLAVQLTDRVGAAGQVLLISTLVSFICAPFIGKLADACENKRTLLICGHLGIAFSGVVPLAGSYLAIEVSRFSILIVTLILATVSAILAGTAMDYFIKSYIPVSVRAQRLASLNIATQMALIIGTGIGGLIVAMVDFRAAFLVISGSGLVVSILCGRLLPNLIIIVAELSNEKRWIFSTGPMLYFRYSSLLSVACCAVLVFSVGQITNTLLPALVLLHLQRGSVSYSLVEAAWSSGAFCISILFARKIAKSLGNNSQDLAVIAIMAIFLAMVPQLKSFDMLLATHFFLGASFALVRIRSEARFLALCPLQLMGRMRANSLFLTSAIGLIVFSVPLVFSKLSVSMLYGLLAGMVLTSVIAILFFIKMRHSSTPLDEFRENQ